MHAKLFVECVLSCFAGVPPPDHYDEETVQELATIVERACARLPEVSVIATTSGAAATPAEGGVPEPASSLIAPTAACMPSAALPVAVPSQLAAAASLPSASKSQPLLATALPVGGHSHGARVQASVPSAASQHSDAAYRPAPQCRDPSMAAGSSDCMPAASGVHPATLPTTGLLTSAAAAPPPPAVHALMGGHGLVYVPGYGVMPVVPPVVPGWRPSQLPGMPMCNGQSAGTWVYGSQPVYNRMSGHVAMPNPPQGVPPGPGGLNIASGTMPVSGSTHLQHNTAAPAAGSTVSSQPQTVRAFPQLSSFKSLEDLYELVTYGDTMSDTLSFADRTKADPDWRKVLSKRFFEIDSAVKEMTERADAEFRQSGQKVSPRKHAKIMDEERVEHGKSKDMGKPTPVASWVKTVLGPIRAERNKKQKGVLRAFS